MWLAYAFLATVASSARSLLSKKVVTSVSEWTALWTFVTFALPIACLYLLLTGFMINNPIFWPIIAVRILIDTIATYLYFKALKLEEVSYIAPLYTFQPILTTATSYFINHETPTTLALTGMGTIIGGTLCLFVTKLKLNHFHPNPNLLKATGFSFASMFFWSFASAIHKQGVLNSSPATYFFVSYVCFTLLFGLIAYLTDKTGMLKALSPRYRAINIGNGLSLGFDHTFTLTAIATGFVGYVDAIKSSSTMVTSFLAVTLLKEKLTPLKTISILIVSFGVLLILLGR